MTTIITRRCWGTWSRVLRPDIPREPWPPDVAYVVTDANRRRRMVTWDEMLDDRRVQQRERLEEIMRPATPRIRPCYVWVFKVPGWLYAGWWCYVKTRSDAIPVNFRHLDVALALSIMRAAPCGFLPLAENFAAWMPVFARRHPRPPCSDPRPAGSLVGWLVQGREFVRDKDVC